MGETIRVTKEFSFEMSHMLANHQGGCRNLHGHSYRLFVTVSGEPRREAGSPSEGMVIDFGELKRIVNEHIISVLDHSLLISEATSREPFIAQYGGRKVTRPFEPTCENMILWFARLLRDAMPAGARLFALRLHETATSYAEWYADDNR